MMKPVNTLKFLIAVGGVVEVLLFYRSSATALEIQMQVNVGEYSQRLVLGATPYAHSGYDALFDVPAMKDGGEPFFVYIENPDSGFEVDAFWRDFVDYLPHTWKIVLEGAAGQDVVFSWKVDSGPSFRLNRCFRSQVFFVDPASGLKVSMTGQSGYAGAVTADPAVFYVEATDRKVKRVLPPEWIKVEDRGDYYLVRWGTARSQDMEIEGYLLYVEEGGRLKRVTRELLKGNAYIIKKEKGASARFGVQAVAGGICRSNIKLSP